MKSIITKILALLIALLDAGYFFYILFCYTFSETEAEKKFYSNVINISVLGHAIVIMLIVFATILFSKDSNKVDDNDNHDHSDYYND